MSKDKEIKAQDKKIREGLELLEKLEKHHLERAKESRKRIDFIKGVALGLILGILGNLFVQHWYPLFERVVLWNFDIVFWSNLPVCVLALAIVLYTTRQYLRQLKEEEEEVKWAKDRVEKARRLEEEGRLLLGEKQ